MGRTLLSDAFDLYFHLACGAADGLATYLQAVNFKVKSKITIKIKSYINIKINGVGQECPTHTFSVLPCYPHS